MRRLATLCLFCIVAMQSYSQLKYNSEVSVESVGVDGFTAVFSYGDLRVADKGEYLSVSLDGTFPFGNVGTPSLPVSRRLIAVPECENVKVVVSGYSVDEVDLSQYGGKKLFPQQKPVSKSDKHCDFAYDKEAYETDEFFGKSVAWVSEVGTMRGVNVAVLNVVPISYNPVKNVVRVLNDIEVQVVFENVDEYTTAQNYRNAYTPYFAGMYSRFINKDIFDTYSDLYCTPVRMLVVANEYFADALQPWLEWKAQKGIYTDVKYVNSTNNSVDSIKNWVHAKYSEMLSDGNAPSFLVIVGDTERVPASATGTETDAVTDLYYASVDGDYMPDMYCSRISAITLGELRTIIEKTLMYEKCTMSDPSYLGKALLIAGADDDWNEFIAQPTINYAVDNYFNLDHGYGDVYAYLDSYDNCYSHLSSGVGIAHYTAHGGEQEWCNPNITNLDINSLTNDEKYFIGIGTCCLSGNFGYSSTCFGEKLIRSEKRGAVAYIGSAPVSYWYEDYYWALGATNVFTETPTMEQTQTGAYDLMFDESAFNTLSSLMNGGNLAVTNAYNEAYTDLSPRYYWEAYNILGDGSIMPYFSVPSAISVAHDSVFVNGAGRFHVESEPMSYVALSAGSDILGTALIGANGAADVLVRDYVDADSVLLVVTRQQRAPFIKTVPVSTPTGAYLALTDYSPEDVFEVEGELSTVISIDFKNIGASESGEARIFLRSENSDVHVEDSVVSCASLSVGDSVHFESAFSVRFPVLSDGEVVPFVVSFVDTLSGTFTESHLQISVHAPKMLISSSRIEGNAVPGETIRVRVEIRNDGSADCNMPSVCLLSRVESLEVEEQCVDVDIIASGEQFIHTFDVDISADSQWGDVLPLVIKIESATEVVDTIYVSIDPCNSPIVEFPYVENFQSPDMPECWSQVMLGASTSTWTIATSDENGQYSNPSTNSFAYIYSPSYTTYVTMLVTPKFSFAPGLSAALSFRHIQKSWQGDLDKLSVYYKNSEYGDWVLLTTYSNSIGSWRNETIELPNLSDCYYIAFSAEMHYGFGIALDDVSVDADGCIIPVLSFSETASEFGSFSWTGNADYYVLYKNNNELETTTLNTYSLTETMDSDGCFRVVAHCGENTSESNVWCASDVDGNRIRRYCIFPNPVVDILEVSGFEINSACLYDVLGRLCGEANVSGDAVFFDLGGVDSGLYILVLKFNDGTQAIEKIVKE